MGSVVVIGAGYAGVRAAKAARRHGASVLLVDADGRHHFGPRLAGVAGGAAAEGDASAPVSSLLGMPVEVGTVRGIDLARHRVSLASGSAHEYDALVVTTGAVPTQPGIRGLDRFALDLKTADDASAVRRALARTDRVVVIGGGTTGVQIAGEIAANTPGVQIDLVEAGPRLLPEFPAGLARRAASLLTGRGVRVRVASPVAEVTSSTVRLVDGTKLAGTAIWAGGFSATGHELLPDVPVVDGRLQVRDTLQVDGHPDVFVAGDAAAHVDLLGRPLGMSAQVAVQAGKAAGRNAALLASGREPIPALLLDLGRVVMLGGGRGVAHVGPLRLGGFGTDRLVPLLHELIDLRHLFDTGGLDAIIRHGRGQAEAPRPNLRLVRSTASGA